MTNLDHRYSWLLEKVFHHLIVSRGSCQMQGSGASVVPIAASSKHIMSVTCSLTYATLRSANASSTNTFTTSTSPYLRKKILHCSTVFVRFLPASIVQRCPRVSVLLVGRHSDFDTSPHSLNVPLAGMLVHWEQVEPIRQPTPDRTVCFSGYLSHVVVGIYIAILTRLPGLGPTNFLSCSPASCSLELPSQSTCSLSEYPPVY